jgi:endonuclease/exonuclease/phosphatase family metal-dependent hydrolase
VNAPADSVLVATLNVRNRADRWRDRAPLLLDQLVELRPDVIGLQEIRRPLGQGSWLRREVNRRLPPGVPRYAIASAWKTGPRRFWEGLAVMTHLPILDTSQLDLGGGSRVAQRVCVRLPTGQQLAFYNTHLHHLPVDDALRLAQAERIVASMDGAGDAPRILVGDFNSEPDSSVVRFITSRFRSAHSVANGAEPELTAPTPLNAAEASRLATIDYIFVDERVTVHAAWLTFTRADSHDDRLYASDHYGIAARVSITT